MSSACYRHHGCRITDDLVYKGMRTLFLENELVRVGILLDKGADLFQFVYKPTDTDFLWISPQGLIPPARFTPTVASSAGSFLDSYHGGWQEILPGGGPMNYRGAEIGLHGEVTHLGWNYEILEDTPECIRVRLSVECVRTPLRLVKTLRLESGKATLFIEETLTNLSSEAQDVMWGQHPAFGAPFLKEGVRLFVPARRAQIHEPQFAASGIFSPGAEFDWPLAQAGERAVDLSRISGPDGGFADLLYLKDLSAGWFALIDPQSKVGFGLSWPLEVFPYLWFWLVYGRAPGFPWWDRAYVIALEPWTSIPNRFPDALANGSTLHLKGGESLSIQLAASAFTGKDSVSSIDPDGTVR